MESERLEKALAGALLLMLQIGVFEGVFDFVSQDSNLAFKEVYAANRKVTLLE